MSGNSVKTIDKIISFLSYISAGWVGFIYCILLYIGKKTPSHFLRYNVFQSIFISLLFFVLAAVLGFIFNILLHIPIFNAIISWVILLFNKPILLQYSIIQILTIVLVLYLSVTSLFGKYPRIIWISKVIDNAAR